MLYILTLSLVFIDKKIHSFCNNHFIDACQSNISFKFRLVELDISCFLFFIVKKSMKKCDKQTIYWDPSSREYCIIFFLTEAISSHLIDN